MERVISAEERIRRAEEIYYKRQNQGGVRVSTTSVNSGKINKVSLGRKMCIQIFVCLLIYLTFYVIKGYNNIFSENVINTTKMILNYDVNFGDLYKQSMEYFNKNFNIIVKDNNIEVDANKQDSVENNIQENVDVNVQNQENTR